MLRLTILKRLSPVSTALLIGPSALLLVATCSAQQTASTFHISGTAVDSLTGAPIPNADVGANFVLPGHPDFITPAVKKAIEDAPHPKPTVTDSEGRFEIAEVVTGEYRMWARKDGYTFGSGVTVRVGPSRESLTLRMVPLAKITGRVLERSGQPLFGATLEALQFGILNGWEIVTLAATATTDLSGQFKLSNLAPGNYRVMVIGRHRGPSFHKNFAPIYYGGSGDRISAEVIRLRSGQAFEANLRVTLTPAFQVSGRVSNGTDYPGVKIELLRDGLDVSGEGVSVDPVSGRFQLTDIVPGAYLLRALSGTGADARQALRQLLLNGSDIDGLDLPMFHAVDITGEVRSESNIPLASLRLRPVDWPVEIETRGAVTVQPNMFYSGERTIHVHSLLPGRYWVNIDSALVTQDRKSLPHYVASASYGGEDLLKDAMLIVKQGAPPEVILIVLSSEVGEVVGTVPAFNDRRWVHLVRTVGGNWLLGTVADAMVAGGKFSFSNLGPGDYMAFLLPQNQVEYRNPDVLRKLKGEMVHVRAGTTTRTELKELAK